MELLSSLTGFQKGIFVAFAAILTFTSGFFVGYLSKKKFRNKKEL